MKVLISRTPSRIYFLSNDSLTPTLRDISVDELRQEIKEAFGVLPMQAAWAQANAQYPNTRCALAAFRCADLLLVPPHVSLFCAQLPVFL